MSRASVKDDETPSSAVLSATANFFAFILAFPG